MQPCLFDQDRALAKLDQLNDLLLKIDEIVNWEGFRLTLETFRPEYDKREGGRSPLDVVLQIKNAGYLPRGGQIIDVTTVEAPVRKSAKTDYPAGHKVMASDKLVANHRN